MEDKGQPCLIVGCGKIAGRAACDDLTHAEALGQAPNLYAGGCVDIDREKAERFGDRYGCNAYTSLSNALKKVRPVVVSICTPDVTHHRICMEVLESAHKPQVIFLEKPACTTLEEYKDMKAASHTCGAKIIVNHSRRFSDVHNSLRQIFNRGELGRLIRAKATYYGGWIHNATHIIDTLCYFFDGGITWRSLSEITPSRFPDDPCLSVSGILDSCGAEVIVEAIDEKYYQIFEFDLWFESGRVRIEDFGNEVRIYDKTENAAGENVLSQRKSNGKTDSLSCQPMLKAYLAIDKYLSSGNDSDMRMAEINKLTSTVESLLSARILVGTRSER